MNAVNETPVSDIELLLPWHAAGTLGYRDSQRVETALANDPELARRFELVRDELNEDIHLNETLGAPSARAMEALFAKIDAEPVRTPPMTFNLGARVRDFFAGLSPRTLAWSASAAAVAILLQAGLIAGIMIKENGAGATAGGGDYQTASVPSGFARRWLVCADPFSAAGQCRRYRQISGNQQSQRDGRPDHGRAVPGSGRADQAADGRSRQHREEAAVGQDDRRLRRRDAVRRGPAASPRDRRQLTRSKSSEFGIIGRTFRRGRGAA